MLAAAATIAASYLIGSVPAAYLAGRIAKGIDIREYGSGNVGASNVYQSVSKWLVVPVGLAQIGQGCAGVGMAKLAGQPEGVQVAAGLAVVIAHDWCPWLRFTGGRGIGPSIGVLVLLSPVALGVFIGVSVTGVGVRAIPQGTGAGLLLAPFSALAAGQSPAIVAGCAALAAIVMLKRLLANGPPAPEYGRPGVWLTRLVYDRDTRNREAWVRRNVRDETGSRRG